MTTWTCDDCGRTGAIADGELVLQAAARSGVDASRSKARFRAGIVVVCPRCDAYALGIESTQLVPFYSNALCAFATVDDLDWWNVEPAGIDIREWPDFGCVTFSARAIDSAVDLARSRAGGRARQVPFDVKSRLAAAAGFPADDSIESCWSEQLFVLQRQLDGRHLADELEAATVTLLNVLAMASTTAR